MLHVGELERRRANYIVFDVNDCVRNSSGALTSRHVMHARSRSENFGGELLHARNGAAACSDQPPPTDRSPVEDDGVVRWGRRLRSFNLHSHTVSNRHALADQRSIICDTCDRIAPDVGACADPDWPL